MFQNQTNENFTFFLNTTNELSIHLNNQTLKFNDKEILILQIVNYYIYELLGAIVFTLGILFNILSFTYFQLSRSFKDTSMRYYFSVISITDSLRLIEWPIIILIDKKVVNLTNGLCKILLFITTLSGLISIWLLAVLSIERYIILRFPFRGKVFYKIKTSIKILLMIITILFLINIPYFLPDLIRNTYSNYDLHLHMCNINTKYHVYMFINTLILYSFIPFIILLIFNILLICLLAKQKKQQLNLFILPQKTTRHSNLKQEKKFKEKTIFLILVSFFLILTLSPRYIVQMLLFFNKLKTFSVVFSITKCLIVLEMFNFSFNFFFYILCSKTSRYEFYLIFYYFFYWKWSKKSKVCFCNNCTSQLYQQQQQNVVDQKPKRLGFKHGYAGGGAKGSFSAINSQYQYLCRLSQQTNFNNKLLMRFESEQQQQQSQKPLKFEHSICVKIGKKDDKIIKRKFNFIHFNSNSLNREANMFQRHNYRNSSIISSSNNTSYHYENPNCYFKHDFTDDDSLQMSTSIYHNNEPRLQTFLMRHSNLSTRFPFRHAGLRYKV
jgi:hypothetical protein